MTELKEPAKAQLGDFIVNQKKARPTTSTKPPVKTQNRFEDLDEDRQLKELVLETGEIVDTIPPRPAQDSPPPPPGLTARRKWSRMKVLKLTRLFRLLTLQDLYGV